MNLFHDLEKRRRELGMSCVTLARRSLVSLGTVNRILSGEHEGASFANVEALARALGMEISANPLDRSEKRRQQQADQKAKELVRLVQGTSALEGQGLDNQELDEMIDRTSRELLASNRKLWGE